MESRYDPTAAQRTLAGAADRDGEAIALRAYTARLLGADPAVVLPDTGSVSVKAPAADPLGERCEALWVNAATEPLATAAPRSFVACHLEPLRRAAERPARPVATTTLLLRACQVHPGALEPPAAALLHAVVPAPFVDLTAADAVLQILAQPDAAARVKEVFGDRMLWVTSAHSGTGLAHELRRCWHEHLERHGDEPTGALLDSCGVMTWGASAQESYLRMVAAITKAQTIVAARVEPVSAAEHRGVAHEEQRRLVALAVRGALRRISGQWWIATWLTSPELLRFTRRRDIEAVPGRGTPAPHAGRTKRCPLVVPERHLGDAEALGAALDELLACYRHEYDDYLQGCARQRGTTVPAGIDHWPRVLLVPGLGMLAVGRSLCEARTVACAYEHVVSIIEGAEALSEYRSVNDNDTFDAELGMPPSAERAAAVPSGFLRPTALAGRVAVVTGAGTGIGLATCKAMLAAGAHVVVAGRDPRVLEAVEGALTERVPGRTATVRCDVASEEDCQNAIEFACDAFGGVDILVSNAGAAPSGGLHTESGDTALQMSLDVNLLGPQRIARAASESMMAQGAGGVLLFNASRAAFFQTPESGPYSVPKAALVSLMRQYAVDLGAAGIRSNAVNADRLRIQSSGDADGPGLVARELSPSEYFRRNLLRRETTAEDVAAAFVFLATADATTGCVLPVDGGNPAAFPR